MEHRPAPRQPIHVRVRVRVGPAACSVRYYSQFSKASLSAVPHWSVQLVRRRAARVVGLVGPSPSTTCPAISFKGVRARQMGWQMGRRMGWQRELARELASKLANGETAEFGGPLPLCPGHWGLSHSLQLNFDDSSRPCQNSVTSFSLLRLFLSFTIPIFLCHTGWSW